MSKEKVNITTEEELEWTEEEILVASKVAGA
jgi:hypothetical protein